MLDNLEIDNTYQKNLYFLYNPNNWNLGRLIDENGRFIAYDDEGESYFIDRNGEKFFMPAYSYDSYIIWGLTAMMTVDFLNVALEANIDLKTKGN